MTLSHLPQGRCGLKSVQEHLNKWYASSPSARKVWIEISRSLRENGFTPSPSARKVWIEIVWIAVTAGRTGCHLPQGRCGLKSRSLRSGCMRSGSPSARKVWIEIVQGPLLVLAHTVTFRKEGVD